MGVHAKQDIKDYAALSGGDRERMNILHNIHKTMAINWKTTLSLLIVLMEHHTRYLKKVKKYQQLSILITLFLEFNLLKNIIQQLGVKIY